MHARIGYTEGGRSRYLCEDMQDTDTVEIPDDIWIAYQKHCEACRVWQNYLYKLDQQLTKEYHAELERTKPVAGGNGGGLRT